MRLSSAQCESGLYSAPSRPRATCISPWCPTSQGQGITSSGCQMLQLRQTAAVSATKKHQQQVTAAPCLAQQGLQESAAQRNPDSSMLSGAHPAWRASYRSTHSNPSARSHGTSAEPAVLQQQQQQFAAEVLERAAAAPRPSAPPPDRLTASSSNSSDHSSSQRHRQLPRDRSRPRLSPAAAVVAAAAESTYAADAGVAAGMLGPLGSSAAEARGSKGRPPHKGGSSQRSAAAGAGSNRLSDTDWLLMQRIRQHCHCWEDVAALYEGDATDQFTAQHCAAALYQLAVLWQQGLKQVPRHAQQFVHASKLQQQLYQMQQLAGVLLRAMCSRMQEASLRDIADAWYAAEVLSLLQGPRAAADHTAAAAAASSSASASSSSSVGAAASTGGGALIASAQATFVAVSLQHSSRLLRQPLLQLRSLSRLLTSLAHLGVKPDHDWWAAVLDAAAGVMEQLLQEQQRTAAPGHKGRGSSSSTSRSSRGGRHSESTAADHANAQAVALLGWAVAVLRAPASPAWWRLFHQASAQLMPVMSASHLSNCIYTCALAQQTPDAAWMEAFYACSSKCWPWFMPQGFASTLWSLAALQQQPPLQWLSEFDAASAALLHRFPLRHIGMCLWGLARIQSRQQAAGTALPGQPHILLPPPPQQQQQVQFPSLAWQDQAWAQLSRSGELSADAAQSLSCILWGSVRLGLSVPQARLQELEALSLEVTRSMTPQALAISTWGLGILRGRATNRRFIKRLRSRCIQEPELLQQLPPQGLCMLLCGLARMDAWQPQGFKQQLLVAVTACVEPPKQPTAKQQRKRRAQQGQGNSLDSDSSSSSSSQSQVLPVASLPLVLLQLRKLRVQGPPDVLCKVEARLQQQLHDLPLQQLCLGLFALGAAKHPADAAFMVAALERVDAELAGCRGLDVTHLLYSCATMSGWGGDLPQVLQQPEQRAQLHRLVYHAQQELEAMDQASVAMLLWSLGKLQLQPPEAFLQAAMAATRQLMPSMSLISVVSILEAFKALQYLPPLPWLLEVCAAARVKVTSDSSPKGWQRRKCVRRFEETVEWYNQAMQAAAQAGGSGNGVSDDESQQLDKQQQRQQARVGMLAAGSAGSEAVLAAAVGVAAAVAQQWHP